MTIKDLIAGEIDRGIEAMEEIATKGKGKTGFFYCPYCGLRIPKSEMSKYNGEVCPACGTQMVEEGALPYISRSDIIIKNNSDSKINEENNMDIVNSTNWMNQKAVSDKKTQNIPGDEKTVNREDLDTIRELTEAILVNPNDANSYFIRATLKVRIGDIEGARRDFKMSEICHSKANLEFEDYPLI